MKGIKGKFIMSINDTKEIREIYKDFRIEKVDNRYNAGNVGKRKAVTELLVMNFKPKKSN